MSNNDHYLFIYVFFSYMIEHTHLKIIFALKDKGTLTEAANSLCLSQSALSHQIGYLEKKLGVKLWEKQGRYLKLTQAGQLLLQVAQQILPILSQAEQNLNAYAQGKQGVLRIGVECYPCYTWLTKVIKYFLQQLPNIDIDIVNKFQFSGLEGLLNHHIDVLITPDREKYKDLDYQTLAHYQLILLVAKQHPLEQYPILTPEMLAEEVLFTFPIPLKRLDILNQFLLPAGIKPYKIKEFESIELMLQMVALKRGVCVLPEWLADDYCADLNLVKIIIGEQGLNKQLYLALRSSDRKIPYIQEFIKISQKMAASSFY